MENREKLSSFKFTVTFSQGHVISNLTNGSFSWAGSPPPTPTPRYFLNLLGNPLVSIGAGDAFRCLGEGDSKSPRSGAGHGEAPQGPTLHVGANHPTQRTVPSPRCPLGMPCPLEHVYFQGRAASFSPSFNLYACRLCGFCNLKFIPFPSLY